MSDSQDVRPEAEAPIIWEVFCELCNLGWRDESDGIWCEPVEVEPFETNDTVEAARLFHQALKGVLEEAGEGARFYSVPRATRRNSEGHVECVLVLRKEFFEDPTTLCTVTGKQELCFVLGESFDDPAVAIEMLSAMPRSEPTQVWAEAVADGTRRWEESTADE